MGAQADVVLRDAASANKTFAVGGVAAGVATWFEKSSGLFSGFGRVTLSVRFPKAAGQPVRHQLAITVPTVVNETINSVSYAKVARQVFCSVTVVHAQDATSAERETVMKHLYDCLYPSSFASPVMLAKQVKDLDPTT